MYADRTSTPVCGLRLADRRRPRAAPRRCASAASGRRRRRRRACGRWTLRSRSSASPAWPTTSMPASSSSRATPSRSSTLSSASDYSHGISPGRLCPRPGGLTTSRRPSRIVSRSARPAQPGARVGSAPPTPSSRTSTTRDGRSGAPRDTVACVGARVLGDVRQRLGDDEVGGRLDRPRAAARRAASAQLDRQRRAASSACERRAQPAVGQDRRVDAARQLAQLLERELAARRRRGRAAPRPRPGRSCSLRSARPTCSDSATSRCWAPSWRSRSRLRRSAMADLDEPWRATPAARRRARAARPPGARCSSASAAAAATALTSSGSSRAPRSWTIAPMRSPSRSTPASRRSAGQLDRPALAVDASARSEVDEPQRRVAQRVGERVAQRRARRSRRAQQLADRAGAGVAAAQQARR